MSTHEKGLQRITEILGVNGQEILKKYQKLSPDFADYVVNFGYGDLYSRKGLTDKTREVIALTSLVTQGKTGVAFKAHVIGMLNVGWTQTEVIEMLIFLIGFVGFPSVVEAINAAQEVFSTV